MLKDKNDDNNGVSINHFIHDPIIDDERPILNQEDLQKTHQPIEKSLGLGNDFYTSTKVFELEKQALFANHWMCIGFGKDVPIPNTAYPVNFLDTPLVIIRDDKGEIRVFHNICRHRGMVLIDRPQHLKKQIRCPYHSWCYGLDGKLAATPHFGGSGIHKHEALNPKEFSLLEVRMTLFMDMVFVNLSGDAPDFDQYATDLRQRWGEFIDQPLYHGGASASFSLELKTNWKFAIENYCESYHLPWIHPALNRYSKLSDHYTITSDHDYGFPKSNSTKTESNPTKSSQDRLYGWYSGQGTNVYAPQDSENLRRFPDFKGLSDKWDRAAEYIALYPNVLLGVHRDHSFVILIQPVDHENTIERVELYFSDPKIAPPSDSFKPSDSQQQQEGYGDQGWVEEVKALAELWRVVFEEDIYVVEGMQRGRKSKAFDGGKLSPVMDDGTYHFHQWVVNHFVAD